MNDFEDVRSHFSSQHQLKNNDPWLISLELPTASGQRRQSVFLAEIDSEDGRHVLRVSSPIAPMGHIDAQRCLEFNWQQRVGYLASGKLDDEAYLHLCENRPYRGLSSDELDYIVAEIGALADGLEQALTHADQS